MRDPESYLIVSYQPEFISQSDDFSCLFDAKSLLIGFLTKNTFGVVNSPSRRLLLGEFMLKIFCLQTS